MIENHPKQIKKEKKKKKCFTIWIIINQKSVAQQDDDELYVKVAESTDNKELKLNTHNDTL